MAKSLNQRTIGVVTGSRADYGILAPLLRAIHEDGALALRLMVTGMHLSPEFGLTIEMIEGDGFPIAERVEMLVSSDTPEGIAKSMGLGTIGFAQAFARHRPDMLVVLGDRFEVHAATLAALPFKIPVAHIHGGELTEGAFDNSLRYSITQMSHLHFVATEEYGRRLIQVGEEPWRVLVCGALSLDNIKTVSLLTREEMESRTGLSLERSPLVVTFHPVTLEYELTEWQVDELLAAVGTIPLPILLTMPNAKTGRSTIARKLNKFVEGRASARLVDNLGTQAYFSFMAIAAAMVGNSSSGIIEAMSFGLPVVNIGTRQRGRTRGANVIDVGYGREEIIAGIHTALSPGFRSRLQGQSNPYGDSRAAEKIVERIKEIALDNRLIVKRFYTVGSPTSVSS